MAVNQSVGSWKKYLTLKMAQGARGRGKTVYGQLKIGHLYTLFLC